MVVVESLIWSTGEVKRFYKTVFDCFEARPNDVGLVFLNTRKKYYPAFAQPYVVTSEFVDRIPLRSIGTPVGESEFVRKIIRLDPPEGAFITKLKLGKLSYFPPEMIGDLPDGVVEYFKEHGLRTELYRDGDRYVESLVINVPKETMSIYTSLNLHDAMYGVDGFIAEALRVKNQLLNTVLNGGNPTPHLRWFSKAYVHVISNTHKRTSSKKYFVLDVDSNDRGFAGRVLDLFTEKTGVEPVVIIRTHGGYHFVYDRSTVPDTEFSRSLGSKGSNLITIARKLFVNEWKRVREVVGASGDDVVELKVKTPMSPVPGTYQGGVKVRTGL